MRIKCLVSDLDGTLLKIGNEMSAGVSEQNRRALREFYRQGGHVAIASSRGLDARQMIEQQIGFPVCMIALNGFTTVNEQGEILDQHWMSVEEFRELAAWMEKSGLNGTLVTTMEDGTSLGYGRMDQYPQLLPPGCPQIRKQWRLTFEPMQPFHQGRCSKISLFVEPSQHALASRLLHQSFADRFEIAASDVDMQDISPRGVNKGAGVRALAEGLHLSLDEIAVVGDNENDVTMFEAVPLSYCMDHASAQVLSRARQSVGSVAEALARALESEVTSGNG